MATASDVADVAVVAVVAVVADAADVAAAAVDGAPLPLVADGRAKTNRAKAVFSFSML